MIEVIAGVWITCFVLSMVTVGINFHLTRQNLNSKKLKVLNSNLEKVGLCWSNSHGNFVELTPNAVSEDRRKALRNCLLMGFLGFASIPGFLLLVVVVLSLHLLARSRKERATFNSVLAEDPGLQRSEIEVSVAELNQII